MSTPLFKIILNPVLSKIDVKVGEKVTMHGFAFKVEVE